MTPFYFQQSALWNATSKQSLFLGFGGGESYYGLRGAGGVFYSLPDKRLADAWAQWIWSSEPWNVSLGVGYARFEGAADNQYNSFSATLSVGWYWDGIPNRR